MTEGWGGFLVLLDVFDHVGREPWCIRIPCRVPVVAIFRWATDRAGTIGVLAWTGVGLHEIHTRLVCTSLGRRERYSSGVHGRRRVSWGGAQTASLTALRHCPIF